MAVSLEQLQAFVAAAEAGSFSGAARALRKAQSAVSTQVANLEADLGLELFSRLGPNPVLTPAGERLLLEARGARPARAPYRRGGQPGASGGEPAGGRRR